MNRDWRSKGLCRTENHDPELWFPVGNSGPALRQTADATAICKRCPVITDCLTWALDERQEHGVWGGKSENERRAILKRRHIKPSRPSTAGLPANARTYLNGAGRRRFLALVDEGYTLPQIATTLRLGITHITKIAAALGVATDTADAA